MRMKIIQHAACLLLAYWIGPYFAAFTTEVLVWMGARGDFTWLDWFFRVIVFIPIEFLWIYATLRISQFTADGQADPAR